MCTSYRSDEWKLLSDDRKRELGITFEDDGEFWYIIILIHHFSKLCFTSLHYFREVESMSCRYFWCKINSYFKCFM